MENNNSRCAEWTAKAEQMIAEGDDRITNCDGCGRPFPEWNYDDDTPLVWAFVDGNGHYIPSHDGYRVVCHDCALIGQEV